MTCEYGVQTNNKYEPFLKRRQYLPCNKVFKVPQTVYVCFYV